MNKFFLILRILFFGFLIVDSLNSFGQDRNLRLVIPYSVGTGADLIARIIAPKLASDLGVAVLVDNKAGASGMIGSDFVAKSKPDGSVFLITVNVFDTVPALYKKLPFDPINDFSPISRLGVSTLALVVNNSFPAKNFEEFLNIIRLNPGKFNYSSAGAGTGQHLAMEVLKRQFGLNILHVPYKGASGAANDLLANMTQMMIMPVHTAMPLIKSGRIRFLAIAGDKRSIFEPDIPCFSELGADNLDLMVSFWIAGPGGMNPELVQKMNLEIQKILAQSDIKDALTAQGIIAETSSAQKIRDYIQKDIQRWKIFVSEQKIVID